MTDQIEQQQDAQDRKILGWFVAAAILIGLFAWAGGDRESAGSSSEGMYRIGTQVKTTGAWACRIKDMHDELRRAAQLGDQEWVRSVPLCEFMPAGIDGRIRRAHPFGKRYEVELYPPSGGRGLVWWISEHGVTDRR